MLNKNAIVEAIRDRSLQISSAPKLGKLIPSDEFSAWEAANLSTLSIDLPLGTIFWAEKANHGIAIDAYSGRTAVNTNDTTGGGFNKIEIEENTGILLPPGRAVIAVTPFTVTLSDTLAGVILGRATATRFGVQIATGILNPGHDGHVNIVMYNTSAKAVTLQQGKKYAQLILHKVQGNPVSYDGQYKDGAAIPRVL